ncbi:hypothetical protein PFNF54_02853 [Plasmodium falciparum NF54]|uniref:Uncharacterized protein n=1 Tax=Plasmodium falciparum (isolate NF54) TaxID=5843 RepID=W7JTQ1_PLAFO|nr:hypothetical protein PFNF54_02853 [Plasmodium falciparum NF54]
MDNMYLKNVHITSFFHNYFVNNENINDTLKDTFLQYCDKYNQHNEHHKYIQQDNHVHKEKNYFVHNNHYEY